MASGRAVRETRPYYYDYPTHDEPREPREPRHHRRYRQRDDYDNDDEEYLAARRERRERRQADQARREAELDIDELRARRHSYYTQPEPERRRESRRMAQSLRAERETRTRSPGEVRHDGTRRKKRREVVHDDRSDDYVYGRPRSRGFIEEVTVKRSSAPRRSEEGGSSSRTAQSPPSGSRSASVPMAEAPKVSRSKSAREPSRAYMATRPSIRRNSTMRVPPAPPNPPTRTQHASTRGHHQRKSTGGLLATLFAPPPRASTTIVPKEIPRVECVVCLNDELPATKTAKLGCGHRMCHSCLKRHFTLSVHDPQHMPPKCCTSEHIPLRAVERLFDDKFKRTWNRKYQEYTTANRLYCPNKGCGEWIKPSKIRVDMTCGRRYARCGRCNTKVCALCNSRFHTRRECPRDPDTKRLVQMAEARGWQRCFNCKAIVELKEGCNHMTCRCTAQFCMVCAAPWKTCNCPWFSYEPVDDDNRLNDMRIPELTEQDVIEVTEEIPAAASPPARRASTRLRHRGDRGLERAEEALAAQFQARLTLDGSRSHSDVRGSDPDVQVYGVGNAGAHHMNESYRVRPIAVSTTGTTPRMTIPSLFGRHMRTSEPPRAPTLPKLVRASTMAGLSRDGSKRGANRVGTWLSHVEVDHEAIQTAPRHVEVDDWIPKGPMVGID